MASGTGHDTDLRALIEAERLTFTVETIEGRDWWQLWPPERAVFGLDEMQMPRMVTAWGAFDSFSGRESHLDWQTKHPAAIEAARAERPDIAAEPNTQKAWADFAVHFGGLSYREANQWFFKYGAWVLRHASEFPDDVEMPE